MIFCSSCGAKLRKLVPPGDDRPRHCCPDCGRVHYLNPRVVVACIVSNAERVLLCQRRNEPRAGFWTLPGGFLESGETTVEATLREVREEAGVVASIQYRYTLCEELSANEVYVVYKASADDPQLAPGPENLRAEWFREADIPWTSLTFPLVGAVLAQYFRDCKEATELTASFSKVGEIPYRDQVVGKRRASYAKQLDKSGGRGWCFIECSEFPDGWT